MPQGRVASSGRHASGRVVDTYTDYSARHRAVPARLTLPTVLSPQPEFAPVALPARPRRVPTTVTPRRVRRLRRRRQFGTAWTVILAVLASLLVKMFLLQSYSIPSSSMENTLQVGDRVLTNRLSYELHPIHRGDVVVFSGAGTWNGPAAKRPSSAIGRLWQDLAVRAGLEQVDGTVYVKRVIGLPGDTVACCNKNGQVTVNGVGLNESYIDDNSYWDGTCPHPDNGISPRCFGPVKVKPGMLWVLGDHRSVSEDSRRHRTAHGGGAVLASQVLGKAVVVIWPVSHLHTVGTPGAFAGVPVVAMAVPPLRRRARARRRRRRTLNAS